MKLVQWTGRFRLTIGFELCPHVKWYSFDENCDDCKNEKARMIEKLNKFLQEP